MCASTLSIAEEKSSHFSVMKLFSPDGQEPSRLSALIVKASVAFLCLFIALFSVVVIHAADQLESATPWPIVLATLLAALIVACVVISGYQLEQEAGWQILLRPPELPEEGGYLPPNFIAGHAGLAAAVANLNLKSEQGSSITEAGYGGYGGYGYGYGYGAQAGLLQPVMLGCPLAGLAHCPLAGRCPPLRVRVPPAEAGRWHCDG